MKKYFNLFAVFFLITFLVSGCSGKNGSNGATGQQGQTGSTGPQGPAGPTMPVIQSLNIQGVPAMPGSNVTATVNAQSAQGLTLTYTWTTYPSSSWSITGGGTTPTATIVATGGFNVTGTATVKVSDTNGMYAIGIIALSTAGDVAPVINSITASPNPAAPNGIMTVLVNTYDAQGNQLLYQWTSSAGWQITGYSTTGYQATATVIAPPAYGTGGYVTVTVSDTYGDSVTGTIAVGTMSIIPPSPLNLRASLPGSAQVLLNWNASNSATGYNVYEAATAVGPYSAIGTTTTTSYTVTGLKGGTTYYFAVTAMNSIGESGYSNMVNATPALIINTYQDSAGPLGIAIDASGNVWVTNQEGTTISELTYSSGFTASNTYSGFIQPAGIAIDRGGNVWVTNGSGTTVSELTYASGYAASNTYSGFNYPEGITIDAAGNVWVANLGSNNIIGLTYPAFTAKTYSGFSYPYAIAIDASGNVWMTNSANPSVSELTSSSGYTSSNTYSIATGSEGIAIDTAGNVWVTNSLGTTISELTYSSGYAASNTYSGFNNPMGIAIDAFGNVWVANRAGNTISELTYSSGYAASNTYSDFNNPMGIAIDASGNVWVTNYSSTGTLTELAGVTTGPQFFPCSYFTDTSCPQFQGGGNW